MLASHPFAQCLTRLSRSQSLPSRRAAVPLWLALSVLLLSTGIATASPPESMQGLNSTTPPSAAHKLLLAPVGQEAWAELGISVASAGDLNGDGYDDVIAGAPHFYDGAPGEAYVFFGGPGVDETPDLVLTAGIAGDDFGRSVSGAGDFNADGFEDVIVGARLDDTAGHDAGRVYVLFGGPSPDPAADLVLTGEAVGNLFGSSMAGAGDFNADGFSDLVVGAVRGDGPVPDPGRVYVFFGGPSGDAEPDWIVSGEATEGWFGNSAAGAGDVNGDGCDDLIIGAPFVDVPTPHAGAWYLFFGGPSLTPWWTSGWPLSWRTKGWVGPWLPLET
jgi:hypothetical protein